MGWTSSADPNGSSGMRMMRFDTKEQAVAFLNRMGWKYKVSEAPPKHNFEGEKGYDKNLCVNPWYATVSLSH